jgi:septum formation inhibitor MinC
LDWFVIAIDAFLAGAALLHHANQRRAHAELKKQYARMKDIFKNASRTIQVKDFEKAQNCLLKLGREALEENGDWVLLHRERPLELPHP